MGRFCIVAVFLILSSLAVTNSQNQCFADITFIVDASKSIVTDGVDNFELLKKFLVSIVDRLPIGFHATRIATVIFSNTSELVFNLNSYYTKSEIQNALMNLQFPRGDTNTSGGILVMRKHVFNQNDTIDRPEFPNIGMIFTDGMSNIDKNLTIPQAEAARREKIHMIAIGITDTIDETELRKISSMPQKLGQNYFVSPNVASLNMILNSLLVETCVKPPNPCIADITFIVDGSASIQANNLDGVDNWKLIKNFLTRVVDRLPIGYDDTHIATVLFSNTSELVFNLDTYYNKSDIQDALLNLTNHEGNTNISGGIRMMRDHIFNKDSKGDRPDIPNIGMVITDGMSNVDKELTIPEAEAARKEGAEMIAIGITNTIDPNELRKISSHPQKLGQNYFTSPNFDNLDPILDTLFGKGCSKPSNPCAFARAEITFVVDGSGSIRAKNRDGIDNWDLIKKFLISVVDRLPIGFADSHLATVLFSNVGELVFNLDTYYNKSDIQDALWNLAYPDGNTNLSGGISTMRKLVFNKNNNGDNPEIPNICIIITDGESNVDTENTIPQAEAARGEGTQIIAVGVTNNVNQNELRKVSSIPQELGKNFFTSPNFEGLENILDSLLEEACLNLPHSCAYARADITFIVDGSGSIRAKNRDDLDNWDFMKNFLVSVVQHLNVGNDYTRIATVIFSSSAKLVFNLNTYDNKSDIQDALMNLEYLGQETNTSGGIWVMRNSVFNKDNTSDRAEVPKIGIVITDGESNIDTDNTVVQALAAQKENTRMIAIGVTDTFDEAELQRISSKPHKLGKDYFISSDFKNLGSIIEPLLQTVCRS